MKNGFIKDVKVPIQVVLGETRLSIEDIASFGEGTIIEPTVEFGYQYLEMIQDTRRTTDDATFAFEVSDLQLPLQLLDARRRYAGDGDAKARLDEAFDALIAAAPDEAAAIIAEYAETP